MFFVRKVHKVGVSNNVVVDDADRFLRHVGASSTSQSPPPAGLPAATSASTSLQTPNDSSTPSSIHTLTPQGTATSNAYELLLPPSLVVDSSPHMASNSYTDRFKAQGKMGWVILKDVLKVVKEASAPLAPLQAAVGGFLTIMELIDVRVFLCFV